MGTGRRRCFTTKCSECHLPRRDASGSFRFTWKRLPSPSRKPRRRGLALSQPLPFTRLVYTCALRVSGSLVARWFAWVAPILQISSSVPPRDWYLQHFELVTIIPALIAGYINLVRFVPATVGRPISDTRFDSAVTWAWSIPALVLSYKMLQYHAPSSVLFGISMTAIKYFFDIQKVMPTWENPFASDPVRVAAQSSSQHRSTPEWHTVWEHSCRSMTFWPSYSGLKKTKSDVCRNAVSPRFGPGRMSKFFQGRPDGASGAAMDRFIGCRCRSPGLRLLLPVVLPEIRGGISSWLVRLKLWKSSHFRRHPEPACFEAFQCGRGCRQSPAARASGWPANRSAWVAVRPNLRRRDAPRTTDPHIA